MANETIYGWTVTDLDDRPGPAISLAPAGRERGSLIIEYAAGTDRAVLMEIAGTRVLQAEMEDAARDVAGDEHPVPTVLAALYGDEIRLAGKPSGKHVDALAAKLHAHPDIIDAKEMHDRHLALSRSLQQQRGATGAPDAAAALVDMMANGNKRKTDD